MTGEAFASFLSLPERDYRVMNDMILGDAPESGWIVEQLQRTEALVNRT